MVKMRPKYLWRFRENIYATQSRNMRVLLTKKFKAGILIERNHIVGTEVSILSGFTTRVIKSEVNSTSEDSTIPDVRPLAGLAKHARVTKAR